MGKIIDDDVTIKKHVILEDQCRIIKGSKIHPRCYIRENSTIYRSVIENNTFVAKNSLIVDAVVPPFSNVYTVFFNKMWITVYYDSYTAAIMYIARKKIFSLDYVKYTNISKDMSKNTNIYSITEKIKKRYAL